MGWFSSDVCDSCGNEVESGVQSKHCGHWICCNCIVMRSSETSHFFGDNTMLCPKCGEDTGMEHKAIMDRCRGNG